MKKTAFILITIAGLIAFNSCSLTTANFDELKVCTSLNDGLCDENMPVLSVNEPFVFASALLKNASEGTSVTIEWYYYEQGEELFIDAVKLKSAQGTNSLNSNLSSPDAGFPVGDYEVRFIMDEYPDKSQSIKFKME